MKEYRSASQILFGVLPDQTIDLGRRVWKVKEWRSPIRQDIDDTALRRELIKLAGPWQRAGRDNDYVEHLNRKRTIEIYSLDRRLGVYVEPFPEVWMCRSGDCRRICYGTPKRCRCGGTTFGQLPFVGYHECGAIAAPHIAPCPTHNDIEVILPGTASAAEIVFRCPVCKRVLRRGFAGPRCRCGQGTLKFNVHRASPVYTPRTVVVVNASSKERVRRLHDAGGPLRALSWVLNDLRARRFDELKATPQGLEADLVRAGLDSDVVRQMVQLAREKNQLDVTSDQVDLPPEQREESARQAVTIALALDQSRLELRDLIEGTRGAPSEQGSIYRHDYRAALQRAGLQAVALVDRFPVLTGNFGFNRDGAAPGQGYLMPFRSRNGYRVYADVNETEALFLRLDPLRVARWLERQGFVLGTWSDTRSARIAILRAAQIPELGEQVSTPTPGSALLTLVHSYAHRFIRRAAVFAGIDRNALSELVVAHHLGFFVYAAARGDFVLGGLQAVFEGELHTLLNDVTGSDHRCALDPGCQRAGGACMACLHLGEPSCRYFNTFLNRTTLFGSDGFLRAPVSGSSSAAEQNTL